MVRMLPPLKGKYLIEAARRFRTGTSNIDGMGPRHIGLLGDDATEICAAMCNIWELGGCYPRSLESVIVKLLVKKDGGFRPIMLFRSMFRIH